MAWSPDADQALLCVALLARDADGVVHPDETRFIAERLHAPKERLGLEGELAAVGMLARALRTTGLEGTVAMLRKALEPRANEAVELAFRVALSDQDLDPRETALVEMMAAQFGLGPDALQAILRAG